MKQKYRTFQDRLQQEFKNPKARLWYWVMPRTENGFRGNTYIMKGQPGDLFLSKLTSMVFEISELDEKGNVPVLEVANRLKEALDVQVLQNTLISGDSPLTSGFGNCFFHKRRHYFVSSYIRMQTIFGVVRF
jgi:hypothetical protein